MRRRRPQRRRPNPRDGLLSASGWTPGVQEVLLGHPSIEQAYVVGLPDPRKEEILAAVVVLREGRGAEPEELRAFCKQALAGNQIFLLAGVTAHNLGRELQMILSGV